ncbi:hypothetical protein MSZK_47050 [Mycobacterium sp. shizuoka-1]|nr:hypothetical protein MSZK_47050 [Mycobacterium sp. shizuoka-1]
MVVDTPGSAGIVAAGLVGLTPDSLSQPVAPKATAAIIAIAAQRVACCLVISIEPVDFGREKQANSHLV